MKKKINSNIFRKQALKHLSTTSREHRFVNYDKAKTVFLLFESDSVEKNLLVRDIILSLQKDGKKVVAWGFVAKKNTATPVLPDFRILNQKQTDFFQKPYPAIILELQKMKFDLLIDLSLNTVTALQYFALYANAFCKTGIKKSDLPIYDFLLDMDHIEPSTEPSEKAIDELYLYNKIIFYLKSIQTND